jgi:uncharacterized protein (DUF1330 family)
MKKSAFMPKLALVLLLVYGAFWAWQTPGWLRGTLTLEEVDYHFQLMEKNLAMPADEKAEVLARLRAWALADDGKPVFMLNLMRFYPQVRQFEGAPEFAGTPLESNQYYESSVTPLALALGSYPLFAGMTQGQNLIEHAAELDNWSRVIVMRYPSRRAVLELFADPAYAPFEPYKLMALQVVLTPTQGEIAVPELRWLVGGALLLLLMAIGWLRAAIRR